MVSCLRIFLLIILSTATPIASAQTQKPYSILMFGDSITAGYGLEAKDAPPAQLESILNKKGKQVQVINGGVSGDTTAAGRSRIEWTLDKHKPDMVILALGANDMLRGISPKITRENMHAMVELVQARKITLVLSAVEAPLNLGPDFRNQFNRIYTELAEEHDLPLYPFLLKDTYGNPSLMLRDGIHPNKAGASVIAKALAEYLANDTSLMLR